VTDDRPALGYPPSLRDRLPRGESYPVRRQALDAALRSAGVPGPTLALIYFLRGGQMSPGAVVEAEFRARSHARTERGRAQDLRGTDAAQP
jgi:hypothetical protein